MEPKPETCMVCNAPATESGDATQSLHGSQVRERLRLTLCATCATKYHGPPPA